MKPIDPDPLRSAGDSRPARILAVDDQRDAARLLQLRLQAAGFDCFICPDGASALEFLSRELVDLIILDVVMPRMDGYELCRRLKSNPRTRDIPVLFLTAKLELDDKVQGLDAGAHDYLSKPIEQSELLARTKAALRVKQLQDQLKEQIQLRDKIGRLHQNMLREHWQKILGQLAASLAHEINNPLTVALGNVQLVAMRDDIGDETRDRLQTVGQSLHRVGEKLRSLLLIADTSRTPKTVRLSEIIEDILTVVNFEVVMNKIIVDVNLDRRVRWHGVPGEFATAILYLLNNGIEAVAGRHDARLAIDLLQFEGRGLIRITDNGDGIRPDIQKRIFEPFFTTKPPPHHGVGLFLANEMISSAGGEINFESVPAKRWTEFSISVPIRNAST